MSKTILITGCSSGIGKATAKFFQEKGWNVIATMRTPEKEGELSALDNVLVTKLDVQDLSSIDSAINAGIEKFGAIDVVVNNAGYGIMGVFEATDREATKRQFDVNVMGVFDVTKAVLPHMRKNKSGMIINISSIVGKMAFPGFPLYISTKFAVEGFSEALAYELDSLGVQVKLVEPGAIKTDFTGRSADVQQDESLTEYKEFSTKVMEAFAGMSSSGNMGTSEMVAGVIYEAATDGKKQLRYLAGTDANQMNSARKSMEDEALYNMVKSNFKIN